MIDVNDLRKGVTFELDGELFKVLDYSHNKSGRGNATIRTKVLNLRSGASLEKTFQSGDRVRDVSLDHHNVQYIYNDGNLYYFMDLETFEQPGIAREMIGEMANYLMEGMQVKLTFYQGQPIDIELPITVDQRVVEAEIGVRGDTATGVTIKVRTETGLEVTAPAFVSIGDTIRIDTRSGTYITRV